jgi:hypothetical protein
VGSNLTKGGGFFLRKEPPPGHEGTSAGPWMCVYVFQGLTVGWWKEERHSSDTTARSAGFESQAGWASHGCCVVLSRKEKGEERVGVGGRGKYPGASPHVRKKKEEKNKPTAKVPDRPNGERGKAITKKKNTFHHPSQWTYSQQEFSLDVYRIFLVCDELFFTIFGKFFPFIIYQIVLR